MQEISNSELTEYRRCQRMHWLKNVRRLGPIDPPHPLKAAEIGTRIHAVLERYYRGEDTADILRCLAYDVEHAEHPDHRKAADMVLAAFEGYIDWLAESGADHGMQVLDAEIKVTRELPGAGVLLVGKLDLLTDRGPLDHKTTGYQLAQRIPYLERVTQVSHYLWLLDGRELVLNVLRQSMRTERSTGPFYARRLVRRNRAELDAYERQAGEWVAGLLAQYTRTDVPPPSPGDDCSWLCPFHAVCPSFDNGDDVESLLAEGFTDTDPMSRYAATHTREGHT